MRGIDMRILFLTGVAAMFLATGTAHVQAQDGLDKMLAEDARRTRTLARCQMEQMKFETMDTDGTYADGGERKVRVNLSRGARIMKKVLLAGVTVLFLATGTAHADVTLSPTDPLIGGWCDVKNSKLFKRGSCDFIIEQSSFSGVEETCTFLEIKRVRNGIEAYSECSNDGVLPYDYRYVKATFQIFGSRLKYQELATHSAKKHEASCVSVKPTPDGYLNLREGPGMGFKIKAKLTIGEHLVIDAKTDEWTHTTNVAERRSSAGMVSGWVYSKYVEEAASCHTP
jgi:hypothetical protein